MKYRRRIVTNPPTKRRKEDTKKVKELKRIIKVYKAMLGHSYSPYQE